MGSNRMRYDERMPVALLLLIANPHLDAAEEMLRNFDATGALHALEQARADGPMRLEALVRYFVGSGVAHAYLEQHTRSERAFAALLKIDPGHVLPYTLSPRVTFLFERVRRRAASAPSVDLSWPRGLKVGDSVPIVVEVRRDADRILRSAMLHWRRGTNGSFSTLPLALAPPGEYTTVNLPTVEQRVRSDQVRQIYLSVYDGQGDEVLRVGDADEPREILLRYVKSTRFYERWWFWTVLGAAVVGGTVAAVATSSGRQPDDIQVGVEIR